MHVQVAHSPGNLYSELACSGHMKVTAHCRFSLVHCSRRFFYIVPPSQPYPQLISSMHSTSCVCQGACVVCVLPLDLHQPSRRFCYIQNADVLYNITKFDNLYKTYY